MWSSKRHRAWLTLWALGLLAPSGAHAAPIVAGTDVLDLFSVQTIDLYPGTPFNPGTTNLTVQVPDTGTFTLARAAQSGTTIPLTIPQALYNGVLPGPLPPLPFQIVAGTPGLKPTAGSITNVVQDPADPGYAAGRHGVRRARPGQPVLADRRQP
jgi:hypothetical protein